MKDFVKKVKSFVTFDSPLLLEYINSEFTNTHYRYQADFYGWSTVGTRQKVIAIYWLRHVLNHFTFTFSIPTLLIFGMRPYFELPYLSVIFLTGLVSFFILLVFHYWPNYAFNFLPKLDTVKEAFECRQNEQLQKCRQAQLSNFSLTLLFYLFARANNIELLKADDRSSRLIMKLYGIDPGSIRKNLELILAPTRAKNLTERKLTELQNRFEETYYFLNELGYEQGIQELKEVESRFFKPCVN